MTRTKHVLLVVTSHPELGTSGRSTGAYLSEVAHPHHAFVNAGVRVSFASPRGGRPPFDGTNDPDPISRAFLEDRAIDAQLAAMPKLVDVDPNDYDAVFFAGGHGTMWDFPDDPSIPRIANAILERGGVVSAVCHGPAALVNLKLPNGDYLVANRDVAAFTNDEERAAGVDAIVPFSLADVLASRGARLRLAPLFAPNVVTDGRLVTGQNPASATGVAQAVVALLG